LGGKVSVEEKKGGFRNERSCFGGAEWKYGPKWASCRPDPKKRKPFLSGTIDWNKNWTREKHKSLARDDKNPVKKSKVPK